jgi:Na+-driven multidrug efflux pump
MVGQYLGAERNDDAYRVVWKSAGINMVIVGAMCTGTFFFGKEVTAFFINEPDVLVEGFRYFRIVSLSIPFYATFNIFDAALRGSGYTVASMILNIVRLWGIRLPLIYLFGLSMGTLGIWYAMLISNISIAIAAAFVISSKKWLKKVI